MHASECVCLPLESYLTIILMETVILSPSFKQGQVQNWLMGHFSSLMASLPPLIFPILLPKVMVPWIDSYESAAL